ncbi:MAG: hypothetical protein AAFZ15_27425 [Bacteroidota bacterium]
MENQAPEKKKNVFLISGLVFVVLFILPLGSIYFLNSGKEYRRVSLSEMEDKGKVPAFQFNNQNNITISPEKLRGKVAVVNFISEDESMAKFQTDRLSLIHDSYNDTEDVVFLSFVKNDTSQNLISKASNLGITDHKQWYLLGTNDADWNNIPMSTFQIEDAEKGIALIDTSMTIRRHYDINSDPDMGRLVEQIAIVIPKQKRRGM